MTDAWQHLLFNYTTGNIMVEPQMSIHGRADLCIFLWFNLPSQQIDFLMWEDRWWCPEGLRKTWDSLQCNNNVLYLCDLTQLKLRNKITYCNINLVEKSNATKMLGWILAWKSFCDRYLKIITSKEIDCLWSHRHIRVFGKCYF